MIELYTWATPNRQKVSIMLEEVGSPYRVHPIDITKGEQFAPAFLKIAPNNRIPAIIDTDNGLHLMESGAILLYLAEKTGMLWPQEFPVKWRVVEWLMWQMGGPGPFLGQVHHFVKFNPGKSAYAEERYLKEARRLWGCSTAGSRWPNMSQAIIRSPISPWGRGFHASPGRPSMSPIIPM